jgi:hypothetical protein
VKTLNRIACTIIALAWAASAAAAFRAEMLSAQEQKALRDNFALCKSKLKGPYTENFCVCQDGSKVPVRSASGAIRVPCKDPQFCAAFRTPWAEAVAARRVYIANIFSRDLYLWDSFRDHDDLVRGYILEKHFTETNPEHKLSQLKAFGGLSGAEYETTASARFFERYLDAPEFNDNRDFLLAYELQRRYFVRADLGQIEKVRNLAVRIQQANPKFKPLRDAIHNQISAGLVPQLVAFRQGLPAGSVQTQVDQLANEIAKLTALDASALVGQVAELQDETVRARVAATLPAAKADDLGAMMSLANLMVLNRQTVAARTASPSDRRRLIDLSITAAGVLQQRGSALVQRGGLTVEQHLQLLGALTDATYGTGLIGERERAAANGALADLEKTPRRPRAEFARRLQEAERIVAWAQSNAMLAFAEVWEPWTLVMPQVASIKDDILRSSPLLLYARVVSAVDDYTAGSQRVRHHLFGAEVDTDIRALNPGLARGRLRVAPPDGGYSREDIVALPETPADLEPAAGILTQGEGNVLSHVQLLARALGVPNVVLGTAAYRQVVPHNGREVFLIVTPGGRVILKEAAAMTAEDIAVYEEYTRNQKRAADGGLRGNATRLHIDRARIDLSKTLPISLSEVRRADSGKFCGPKAAYLGELKHLFPDKVARGIVIPFGAYYEHYRNATIAVPDTLRGHNIATAGGSLAEFVERTYTEFFDVMIPAGTSDAELVAWISPRLDVVRHSIREFPLSAELKQAIRDGLDREELLQRGDKSQSVGCFVRSDTNVEDLDNFNGAGLNLTVFNRKSLNDIYDGLKEVWASPFAFRSFSWRQTLIDDPLWVLSSVVILESVVNDKSGVLVTADVNSGDSSTMTVATSEGVGGAVDGTSAETLLWLPSGVELVTLFKSPWRTQLLPGGGSGIVPASGRDTVLEPEELAQLVRAGQTITEKFTPARDLAGKPRAWDIEFGFQGGKLWLFQCRPFLGNDELKNIPALAPMERADPNAQKSDTVSLEEIIR